MKKLCLTCLTVVLLFVFSMVGVSSALIIDLAVTAENDKVQHTGSTNYWEVDANPNTIYHETLNWERDTTWLNFNIDFLTITSTDLISASLNYEVLSVWAVGDVAASLGTIDSVRVSDGLGWNSIDVTNNFKMLLDSGASIADYRFVAWTDSGFTFSSAEGGAPAFLRIETTGSQIPSVPEPTTMILLGSAFFGMGIFNRKRIVK